MKYRTQSKFIRILFVVVLADGHKISADLLIAAEGARSSLRTKQMGAVKTMPYHQQAIVALMHHINP